MRVAHKLWIALIFLAVAGCSLADHATPPPAPITGTLEMTLTPVVSRPSTRIPLTPTGTLPELRTDPGPFTDAAWVLDGVCFEVLTHMNGERWSWATQSDLNAFFDWVDDIELCGGPVPRTTFNFTDTILVGMVQTAQGCDAAYRLIEVVQDEPAQIRTLVLALDVRPGCPYELVQLFLVAVPRLPDSYTTHITLE